MEQERSEITTADALYAAMKLAMITHKMWHILIILSLASLLFTVVSTYLGSSVFGWIFCIVFLALLGFAAYFHRQHEVIAKTTVSLELLDYIESKLDNPELKEKFRAGRADKPTGINVDNIVSFVAYSGKGALVWASKS